MPQPRAIKNSTQNAPGKVRIIGGQWKRTPLAVPQMEGLRPTPDRVRETVFNWLFTLRGALEGARCLDVFAGTGALGLEAASRGAAQVVLVERDAKLAAALTAACAKLKAQQVQVRQGDALTVLRSLAGPFDLAFLDPPYGKALLAPALAAVAPLLAPDALVYAEDDAPLAFAGWEAVRQDRAGAVHYGLLQRANP
ncbi:MAG: 16S rRNA (guanine(966)-N(2))-methyltransferase RsmD [Burkholderiaceae bacterium]